MRHTLPRLITAALLLAPTPALAWWEYGHQTVARIAEAEMTPVARRAAARLLAGSAALGTPKCPLNTLADASIWPDCIKTLGDRFSYASPWHYQNIRICKPFDAKSECPNGQCITAQIPRMARLLADRKVPAPERLQALAFLVHLIGDLHQPLHIGDNADLGGNRLRTAYGYMAPERMNLHRIWDGELAERAISTPPGGVHGLRSEIRAEDRRDWATGTVADWAKEGWQHSRDIAYGKLPLGVGVCTTKPAARVTVREPYVADGVPVVREGIKKAGVRLASLLNAALDPSVPARTFGDEAD